MSSNPLDLKGAGQSCVHTMKDDLRGIHIIRSRAWCRKGKYLAPAFETEV